MFRITGHLLMWIGFFAGSYLAVERLEDSEDAWQTIQWQYYALTLAVGCLGVVILRVSDHTQATSNDRRNENALILDSSTVTLLAAIDGLLALRETISVFQVRHVIDREMMESINAFVTARSTLIPMYGLQEYANVMTDFAMAERVLNRAWSASADGYVDEVWICIERARAKVNLVVERLVDLRLADDAGRMFDGSVQGPITERDG